MALCLKRTHIRCGRSTMLVVVYATVFKTDKSSNAKPQAHAPMWCTCSLKPSVKTIDSLAIICTRPTAASCICSADLLPSHIQYDHLSLTQTTLQWKVAAEFDPSSNAPTDLHRNLRVTLT